MNKARLIRNRMIVQWSGISRITPLSKEKLRAIRDFKKLDKRTYSIFVASYLKTFKNEESD